MESSPLDRRNSHRFPIKATVRVRAWKSGLFERIAQTENISSRGALLTSEHPLAIGSSVEVLLSMPAEPAGKAASEWRCSGRVVRVQPLDLCHGKVGVGVEFDYYEILRSKAGLNS